jgi:hypothetical protein
MGFLPIPARGALKPFTGLPYMTRLCSVANFSTVSAVPPVRLARGGHMSSTENAGRFAGLLYILASIRNFDSGLDPDSNF